MRVSAWANRYRHLSAMSSPEPGPFDWRRTPYCEAILQCGHPDDPTEWGVLRTGTQVGKTEILLTLLYFYMHQFPRSIGYVLPNEAACEDVSVQRVDDGIKASPELRKLVGDQYTKDAEGRRGKDSVLSKTFPGGVVFMLPATSKSKLASKPCGVLLLDEIQRFPRELQGEPDPIGLVTHRSQNYIERKVFLVSTPGDEGDSPICDWYERTTKEVYDVPCPSCGILQPLHFRKTPGVLGGVVWADDKPEDACYECCECGEWIPHDKKAWMLEHGEWRATVETPKLARSRGFHLNALYSPFGQVTWGSLAQKFIEAKSDPVKMRDFVTLDLAEAWQHSNVAAFDEHELQARAELGWGAGQAIEVPGGVQVLTIGVDCQDDRLEASVWGWTSRNEGWLIGHWIFYGETTTKGSAVWSDLASLLLRQFRTPTGMLPISAGGIDSGYGTDAVYHFIHTGGWQRRRIMATKGLSSKNGIQDTRPVYPQKTARKKGTVAVIGLNVGVAKLHLHMRLAKAGMLHFPKVTSPALPTDYFDQICAEELVKKSDAAGHTVKTWRLRKGVDRNEALDTGG